MRASASWWTVRLVVEEEAARPMSGLGPQAWGLGGGGVRALRIGDPTTDADDMTSVTFELQAADAAAAEHHAQVVAARVRHAANVTADMPVAWVAPLKDDDVSSLRFLEQAGELLGAEQFELAIVAAQIHLELQVRVLLERASKRTSQRWAERLFKTRGSAALTSDHSKATVQLLIGIDPTSTPEWPEFKAHLQRRNDVVHGGQTVGHNEAAASIRVVRDLWVRLSDAARGNGAA